MYEAIALWKRSPLIAERPRSSTHGVDSLNENAHDASSADLDAVTRSSSPTMRPARVVYA